MKPVVSPVVPSADELGVAAPRPAPRRLSLRVNGTRAGSLARPQPDGDRAAGPRPTPRIGLRVHGAALTGGSPTTRAVLAREDYATPEDYE